jgi:EAL domain-containing protein (putative c-di-GMP-specific phosphodiesterase class I)/CheY-like chemotaxis protein
MPEAIRILIVDDNPELVSWLCIALDRVNGIEVVGNAYDPDEAARVAAKIKPNVAIVDVTMPSGGGIRATKLIKATSGATAVLIFSGAGDSNAVIEMLRQGAAGYVAKTAPIADIITAIQGAVRGLAVFSEDIASSLRRELFKSAQLDPAARIDETASVERCLEDRRFKVVFQPIVELESRRVRAYEALTRFPEGSPDEWFARAWRVGRGPELELRVIELAFASLGRLPAGCYLSVNVSPHTLAHRGLRELLGSCDPRQIVLEITEHAEIDDVEAFQPALREVRAIGARIAVDDAGAGFANFVRLLQVVPDVIKLDRVLVANIDTDQIRVAIAQSLISLAGSIGAHVTGEGIETEGEAKRLAALDVRFGQGFLFGRPEPLPSRAAKRMTPNE